MKKKIIIVDDEPSLVDFMTGTLDEAGFQVTGCTSPREALKLLDKEEYDLACLDSIA